VSRRALSRRELLGGLCATLAAACASSSTPAPAPGPAPPALPPLEVARLTDLLALAHLRWLLLAHPREIAAIPWLIPAIGTVVPETNFDRFKAATGVDLREVTEAAVAGYAAEAPAGGADPEAVFYLARHQGDLSVVEGRFEQRLTSGEHRSAERPDLVRVAGKIGAAPATLVLIGRDVVGVQRGGSATRGPARIATLYATGTLKKSPTALAENPLRALAARLGPAPLTAFAISPFEGELARGAHGLLAGATAVGAEARPNGGRASPWRSPSPAISAPAASRRPTRSCPRGTISPRARSGTCSAWTSPSSRRSSRTRRTRWRWPSRSARRGWPRG
jgi:hypothetical protein